MPIKNGVPLPKSLKTADFGNSNVLTAIIRGGDLVGNWGDGPPKHLRWGTAHASLPPIF